MYSIYNKTKDKWSMKNTWMWSNKRTLGWRTLGHLKSHLAQILKSRSKKNDYKNDECYLIEYELKEVSRIPLKDILNDYEKGILEKEKEFKERFEERKKKERYQNYIKLRKEFEK